MKSLSRWILLAGVSACGDSFSPTVEKMAGMYQAFTFEVTDTSGTRDYVGDGNIFLLTLDANGTVAGRLRLIGAGEGGADIDADMAGTWTLEHGIITFEQTADTFVRDVEFLAGPGVLRTEFVDDGTSVRIRMVRS